jgi:DNA invertase Pin-like site-specific DNA recombinase
MSQRTVALYLRVSTDDQTVENQRRELVAARCATFSNNRSCRTLSK